MRRDRQSGVRLSEREIAVLRLLCGGRGRTKYIAWRLGLSDRCVTRVIDRLLRALSLEGRLQLVVWAFQRPLVFRGEAVEPELHQEECDCAICGLLGMPPRRVA